MKIPLIFIVCLFHLNLALKPEKDQLWKLFKLHHERHYDKENEIHRRELWERRRDQIEIHNAEAKKGKHLYTMNPNSPFLDLDDKERAKFTGLRIPKNVRNKNHTFNILPKLKATSSSLDLRTSPCMPSIKNQGICGSCWAFTAVTPMEYQQCLVLNKTKTFSLSEQQLVDCDRNENLGCDGGFYVDAWDYIHQNGGINPSSVYPYTGDESICKRSSIIASKVFDWGYLPENDEEQLKSAVEIYGPIPVAIHASYSFMEYQDGIFDDMSCENGELNHAVSIVGYGTTEDNVDYWIIRNSWGKPWGMDGYMLMQRGHNICNLGYSPGAVIIDKNYIPQGIPDEILPSSSTSLNGRHHWAIFCIVCIIKFVSLSF